jgi:hypothetical protein
MSKGNIVIDHFTIKDRHEDLHGWLHGRGVPPGTYTRLMIDGKLVMSDTPDEMNDHWHAIWNAKGSCLINGLGIGMVLKNILLKDIVTDVTVVEINQDLIDLVSPYYKDSRVGIICSDAYEYKPEKGKRYKMVWNDIWNNICSDNLEGMKKLHRKYGRRCDWQGSWGREMIR